MEASSKTKSSEGKTLNSHFHRSPLPSERFCSSSISTSSVSTFMTRATSPTRVSLGRSVSPSAPTVRFSASRTNGIASHHRQHTQKPSGGVFNSSPKRTCACSPTTHPGSFRCSLHKNSPAPGYSSNHTASYRSSSHQLNMRRSAMTNSLVRIGTVEGDLVKRALAALIRPSSHNLRRRADFQPRPSRLSMMSKAENS